MVLTMMVMWAMKPVLPCMGLMVMVVTMAETEITPMMTVTTK